MDRNRLWLIGSVLLMVVAVALGWFVGVAPQLSAIAAADAQRAQVQQLNARHQATLARLKKDFAQLGVLQGRLADLSGSVPGDSASSAFVDEVDSVAGSAGVTVTGVSIADAQPYVPVSPPASGGGSGGQPSLTASAPPSASPAASPTPTPAPTPAPAPTPVAGMPPVTSPELTSSNFSSLAVTLSVSGGYAQILAFVDGMQSAKRLFLVDGITTAPVQSAGSGAGAAGSQTATVSGLLYVVSSDGSAGAATPSR